MWIAFIAELKRRGKIEIQTLKWLIEANIWQKWINRGNNLQ